LSSTYDEDEESGRKEVLTLSAQILEFLALHNQFVFGCFNSPIISVSNTSIEPEFDGFSIKTGEISCVLVASSSNIVDDNVSVFVVLQDDEKQKVLESELKTRDSDFVL